MGIINLQIDQSYLEKAVAELSLHGFPSTGILRKLFNAFSGNVEHSRKMQSMINWIDLLEKKYRETTTSIVYGLAHFIKQQEDGAFSQSQPFYFPSTSYFTEDAVTRSFALSEKLAQLLNVFEELGVLESGPSYKAVSFSKISNMTKIDLSALDTSLKNLNPERHAHTHGMTPEMTRHQITGVFAGSINGERPIEVIMHGIDESKLPVTPYQQLFRCKDVMDKFTTAVSKVFEAIEQSLEPEE
ncbi:hypothetical protein J41TS12_37280 [Paenibacillus antibioticophila]|uniref:Cthe-2314-like HEPN domain-containing protein n=1 Tax=Paenibacillus antibioticophila TaxID=1274374 RepID=A0A919XTG7_9BACL|nr:Cthe_2314 family HEPN domain-containing protein [Paenibacillus antibioticophila]GIO38867.1 hypothetical protein J41TS12_37280 [Paenibacillus antibioticophila]